MSGAYTVLWSLRAARFFPRRNSSIAINFGPANGYNVFVFGNPFAAKSGIFSTTDKPQTTLQNLSDQIVSNQTSDERLEELCKAAQIRKDAYEKTNEATSLEEAPTELLELFLHNTKMYLTVSEGYEQELLDFKEQLQEWDRTIQEYKDMLDGKVALSEGQTIFLRCYITLR